jgi:hypothetical protein
VFNAVYVVKQSGGFSNVIESGGLNRIALNNIITRFLTELRLPTSGVVYVIDNVISDISGFVDTPCGPSEKQSGRQVLRWHIDILNSTTPMR